ncbi:MAG: NAD-dependent dehydratase [Candidatus Pelagibacter sp. TMED273]|nr:MAG: NAD-dependent dehydratase [Candidatus Pelagibacter sp. TMED273]|tara:strand:- start:6233 stop:7387 length:1155 start_codon:yes stop_codon:yes gene_type:complete
MKILILGADGYLGWPTAMDLASKGNQLFLVDNFIKRKIEAENGITPLYNQILPQEKIKIWNKMFPQKKMKFFNGDLLNYKFVYEILRKIKPDTIVHYAEQPSAPYSMRGRNEAIFTQKNNILGTLNLIFGIKKYCSKTHLIKLGTMGAYGQPNIDIEEGFIKITHKGRSDILTYPKMPGSIYHLSKVHDSENLLFLTKLWNLKCTDLNQGVVYGIDTTQSILNKNFNSSFHYDHIFGTILNRFLTQAALGMPLTVYGSGNQIRSFLNINDTLQCINLALKNPPQSGEFKVRNQFTELFSLNDLAKKVQNACRMENIKVDIKKIKNPRIEKLRHYYNPSNKSFKKIGLKPIKLNDEFIVNMVKKIIANKKIIKKNTLNPTIKWRN